MLVNQVYQGHNRDQRHKQNHRNGGSITILHTATTGEGEVIDIADDDIRVPAAVVAVGIGSPPLIKA